MQRDAVGKTCKLKILPRYLGMTGIALQRHQVSVGGQRTREPDRAVAAERADLKNPLRALRERQQMQKLALARGDLNRGQPRGPPGPKRPREPPVPRGQ